MPISFEQINAIPDPLPNNRHELRFPSINGADGYDLTLRHGHVTLPAATYGQIRVSMFGHKVAFAGNVAHDNTLSVTFTEDSQGTVLQALIAWQQLARNVETGTGGLKQEYAANGELYMYDTMGNKVLTFILFNMWPMVVNYPDMGEETGPAQVEVQFSVDAVDLKSNSGAYGSNQTGKKSTRGAGANFAYSTDPTSVDFGSSFGNLSIDGSNADVRRVLQLGSYQANLLGKIPVPDNAFTLSKLAQQFGSMFR